MWILQSRKRLYLEFEEKIAWLEAILLSRISELQAEQKSYKEEHRKSPLAISKAAEVIRANAEKKTKSKEWEIEWKKEEENG